MFKLIATIFYFYTSLAFSYQFTNDFLGGAFWKSFPISVSFISENSTLADNTMAFLIEAEKEWESEAGIDMWDIQWSGQQENQQQSIVRWSSNFSEETGYNSATTLAVTIRYQRAPYLLRTEIILNA